MATKLNIKTGTGSDDFINLSAETIDWKVNLGDGDDVLLGGSGNDTVNAGDGNDKVTGGGGNDSINGNDGFDTAVYSHSVFDYLNENGMLTLTPLLGGAVAFATAQEGTDTLKNVEALQFADATYYMDGRNNAPIAQNLEAQTDEDTAVAIDMNGHYVDLDGDALTLTTSTTSGALVTFDADTNTLVYDPNGQFEYLNDGESAVDTITYQVDDGRGGVTTAQIAVQIAGVNDGDPISDGEFHAAYMTGTYDPWSSYITPLADDAMDMAFNDKGGWDKFNGFDASVFSGEYDFVYLDGGDGTTLEFEAFVNANRDAIEEFVSDGGSLLINAGRWDDSSGFDLGFGVTLTSNFANDVTVNASDLIDGPNGYAGTNFTGSAFGHDTVSGEGLSALITDPTDGSTVLGEMAYGDGVVLAGGMTDPYFHYALDAGGDPTVLRANIYEHAASQTYDWMLIA